MNLLKLLNITSKAKIVLKPKIPTVLNPALLREDGECITASVQLNIIREYFEMHPDIEIHTKDVVDWVNST